MKKGLLLVIAVVLVGMLSCVSAFAAEVSVKPKTDSRKVTVNVKKTKKEKATKYKFTAKMYNGEKVMKTKKGTINLKKNNGKDVQFTFPYYGKWKLTGYLYKGSKKVKTFKTRTVKVRASEYNILEFRSTTPVLVTTLKMLGDEKYTTGEKGQLIPTMVCLGRDKQYNWSKLPRNWFRDPMEYKATTPYKKVKAMEAYVKMLYEISPKAKFHIYFCDYHAHELPGISYGAGIPDKNLTLTMVTDGSASYAYFRKAYAEEENAQTKHNLLIQDYLKYRAAKKKGKDYTPKYSDYDLRPLRMYSYAILDAESSLGIPTEWWVVRKSNDTFELTDKDFQAKVIGDARVSSNYINGLLSKVQAIPKQEKIFKNLYNFDDSAIKNAIKKGKKPMMILGTSKGGETNDPIAPFIRFTKKYYGDEYAYFYKGHPGYITEDYPERMAEMKNLGCTVLDSSIAAELFIFYNPDLYMSGYQTSTFQNAGAADMKCGLFNIRKATAIGTPDLVYAPEMDYFITNMKKVNDEKIKAIVPNAEHDNYLVEYSDAVIEQTGNEISIWDDTDGQIYNFYQDGEGNYIQR